jgi:CRISPR system Cascade subunit CasE
MYLSRLLLNPRSRAVLRDLADCQDLHRTIMSAYPQILGDNAREQLGVLYRLEADRRRNHLVLYVQSWEMPDWSRLPSGYLDHCRGLKNPACRPVGDTYQKLKVGDILSFRLKANPTRKIGSAGLDKKSRRVDLRREEDQREWLDRKGEQGGFEVLGVMVQGSVKETGRQNGQRNGNFAGKTSVTLVAVNFEGRLRITDAEKFYHHSLARGIGPGKAYGMGLLSLAPA